MSDAPIKQQHSMQDSYEVEVEGHFSPIWLDWLDGWEITQLNNGNTRLTGWVIDQPALHGLFARIRDLNLKIVSLKKCACAGSVETQRAMKL